MMVLCAKAHVKEIVKDIYENPGIQHGVLAQLVGIRTNYLSQLAAELEEVRCLRRFGTRKCTFYELTLAGKDYARKNFSEERNFPAKNYLPKNGREEELIEERKGGEILGNNRLWRMRRQYIGKEKTELQISIYLQEKNTRDPLRKLINHINNTRMLNRRHLWNRL